MAQKEKVIQFCCTGRRKCAVARVKLCEGTGKFIINGKTINEFSSLDSVERTLLAPLMLVDKFEKVDIEAKTSGGGIIGQSDAIALGVARSLEKMDPTLRAALKQAGMLTRDSRIKERKKPGRPGARKRFQFSKR